MSPSRLNNEEILLCVRNALGCEARAIESLADRIGAPVVHAVEALLSCEGRLVLTGMGKMGLIARKAAATFSSTGAPAIFLHPVDALHGDIGVVTKQDVLVALSNSGSTDEVNQLLSYMQRREIPVLALTGNLASPLARQASIVIDTSVEREADPGSNAPTASSTVALAMCDALAVALMQSRGFTPEQFAEFHPAGSLGRRLLTTVGDVMVTGEALPIAPPDLLLRDALVLMSQKAIGCAFVCDVERLLGIVTDGDLRRTFECSNDPLDLQVDALMTADPVSVAPDTLAARALGIMENKSITVLPVTEASQLIGAIHLHHLLAAGLS